MEAQQSEAWMALDIEFLPRQGDKCFQIMTYLQEITQYRVPGRC